MEHITKWRMRHCLGAALFVVACQAGPSSAPGTLTAPSSVVPTVDNSCIRTQTPTNPGVPLSLIPCGIFALSGVVRVAGVPTTGASVALLADRHTIASVITDRSGAYSFPEVSHFSFSGALVGASMPGYFTDTKYILMTGPGQLDFDLFEAAQIPFGQKVRSFVGDARCASLGYGGMGGAPCRRLAVTVPASGTLVVTLSATPARPFDISILTPVGAIAAYHSSSTLPIEVTVSVEAGVTYQMDVVALSNSIDEFELATTMR